MNELLGFARRVRALGRVTDEHGAAVADAVVSIVRSDLAAGRAPGGSEWPETQEGLKPLRNAASHVRVSVHSWRGVVAITLAVTGHYALHDLGRANGAPRRAVLPDETTPEIAAAVEDVLMRACAETMRGGS